MTRFRYAETVDELQRRLDDGTATPIDLETARSIGLEPNRTAYKDRGMTGQDQYNRAQAALQSASRAYDQVVQDNKRRAEKAFHGHVSNGAAPRRNPAEPSGANPPHRQDRQQSRAAQPKVKPIMIDGQDYGPTVEQLTRGPQQVQKLSGRGNASTQRPPAKKEYQDEYLNMAAQLTGHWPSTWAGPMGYKEGK